MTRAGAETNRFEMSFSSLRRPFLRERANAAYYGVLAGLVFPLTAAAIRAAAAARDPAAAFLTGWTDVSLFVLLCLVPAVLGLLARQVGIGREKWNRMLGDQADLIAAYERFYPSNLVEILGKEHVTDVLPGDSKEAEMTVLFSDIRDFTTLSETMESRQVFDFLQSYLSRVTGIFSRNNGIIDKFIGDSIMAIFPGSAYDARKAATDLLLELEDFNLARRRSGFLPVRIGIGLHRGNVTLGALGSSYRMDCTVIGDTVNLASRIESLTKRFHVPCILTDSVFKNIEDEQREFIREIDNVKVKGRARLITLYESFANDAPELIDKKLATLPDFLMGLYYYRAGELEDARHHFSECQARAPEDSIPVIYLNRIEQLLARAGRPVARRDVLVVEDNGAAADLARHMLGKLGFHARVVETAEDALSALRTHRPDLVLVDVQLPGMNGFEAAERMAEMQNRYSYRAPIVIMSANEYDSKELRRQHPGVAGYLQKPFNRERLEATLSAHAVQNNQGAVLQIEVD